MLNNTSNILILICIILLIYVFIKFVVKYNESYIQISHGNKNISYITPNSVGYSKYYKYYQPPNYNRYYKLKVL